MPVYKEPITEYQQNRGYSSVSPIFMERTIRGFVRAHTPGVQYAEDGLPVLSPEESDGLSNSDIAVRRGRYRPEEAQTILDHREEILELAVKDRLVMAAKPDAQRLDEYIRLQKPDYTPLTDSERAEREAFSDEMRVRYATFAAKRDMTIDLLVTPETPITRTAECLLKVDVSDEGIAWNRELIRDLGSKDPAVRKKAYGRALIRIADETDMTRLDLTDDSNIKDNFESFYSLMSSGAEIQALVEDYLDLGGETDPEVEKRLEKLYAMHDAAGLLRARVDTLASPVHSMVRTEQLYKDAGYLGFPPRGADDKTVEPDSFLYPGQMPDDYFITNFMQIQATKVLSQGAPYMNYDMTPEQRLEASVEDNKTVIEADRKKAERRAEEARRKAEQERLKKEAHQADIQKYVNMERMPQGLTPEQRERRINYEIQLRRNIESLQTAIKANNEKYIPLFRAQEESIISKYMADVQEADATLTGAARDDKLRRINAEKDAAIRKLARNRADNIAGELELTEDQIQSYLTPERMALMDRAKAAVESQEERRKIARGFKDVPDIFSRVLFASVEDPKQPNAKHHNGYIEKFIGAPDYRSQLERRELVANNVRAIRDLDSGKMSWDRSFAELADYTLEHLDACEIGYEFQSTHRNMEKSVGFAEREEFREYMKNIEDKGVALGGMGRTVKELLETDSYMKLPFEHLDQAQISILVSDAISKPEEYGINTPEQISNVGKFSLYVASKTDKTRNSYTEPQKGDIITPASFEDCLPDLAELRQQLEGFESQLGGTDHWYNRRSSSEEYYEMRSALRDVKEELGKLPTAEGDPERMHRAESRLIKAAKDYAAHVGDTPRNENQKLRLEAAQGLEALLKEGFPNRLLRNMLSSNAVAKPEEREFFQKMTTSRPKTEKRELSEDTRQKIALEDKITGKLKEEGAARQTGAEKQMYSMLVSARTSLQNELKKPSPDPKVVKSMVAVIVTCQMYRRELEGADGRKPNPDMTVVYDNKEVRFTDMNPSAAKAKLGSETIRLMNSAAFREAIPKLTEEKLHQFLLNEEPAKTEIMRDICGNMDRAGEAPEGTALGSPARNKTRQTDVPRKESKLLGK